ncbi:ABC transporter substrate-binding protein [Kordiimonas pumila]|uniref:ABC transporter substrate-binding protein n=1 Tax=Kordiimonas pumila TaxID=2161677 RepID=A0ABV7D429_9PROT|nr:ABC transporter substrate-binding protein [Kordiimonas pumila]
MKGFYRQLVLYLTVAFMAFVSPAYAVEPVKVGVLVPLTGVSAADGGRLLRAHELAARQINEAGGIRALGGATIELVVADTQSRPEIARSEAERLISRSKVSVIMGAWTSSATIPSMQVAERYRTPFIVTSAVTDKITEQNMKFVFRVAPKGSWAAVDVAKFIRFMRAKGQTIDKVALVYEDGPFGQTVSDGYKHVLATEDVAIVSAQNFKTGSPDLSTQAAKLKASGADLVLSVAYVDDEVVLLRALAAQRYSPFVLGFGGGHVHPSLLQIGDLAEGTFGVVEWMSDIQKQASTDFVTAYKAAYGDVPLSNAAQAYASTWVAALALEGAGARDTVKVRDALRQLHVETGPASLLPGDVLAFDENGQNTVGNVIAEVVDGAFVTVWPEAVASSEVKNIVRLPASIETTNIPSDVPLEAGEKAETQQSGFSSAIIMQAVISGLANGAIYGLIAVGLTLIFGVMRVINFAHGEFLMIAMYLGYFAWAVPGIDPVLAVFIVTPILMLAGVLLYGGIIRFTIGAPEINQMAVTLGLSLLLQHLALVFFTGDNRLVTLPRSSTGFEFGSAIIQMPQLIAGAAAFGLLALLYLILKRTDFGLMMRSVSQSSDGAALSGIDISSVYKWSMAVGIGTLGVAGPLLVSVLYVNPHVGALFTLKAFVIVIIGGLGSFGGALVGALIVGLAESIAGVWFPASFAAAVPFGLLILILLVRPQGLFSQKGAH